MEWNHEKDMFITVNYLLIKNYGFSENIFEIKRHIFYIIVFKLLWLISFTITVINILIVWNFTKYSAWEKLPLVSW